MRRLDRGRLGALAPAPARPGCRSAPRSRRARRRPISSASRLLFAPAWAAATSILASGSSWPQPCGMLTTPGMIASVTSTGTSIEPRSEVTRDPARRPRGRGARRRRDGRARCSGPCRARGSGRCASTSCSSAAGGGRSAPSRRCGGAASDAVRRSTSATIGSGASSILPLARAQDLGDARLERPEVDAVRRRLEPFAASVPPGSPPKWSPYGPLRSIQSSIRSGPRRGSSAASSSCCVAAGERRGRVLKVALHRGRRSRGRRMRRRRRPGPGRRRCRSAAAACATRAARPGLGPRIAGE